MALALHANSVSGTLNTNGGTSISHTATSVSLPDACMVYVQFGCNRNNSNSITITPTTPTNTGTGLTWTLVKDQYTGDGTNGGGVIVYRAYNASAQTVDITFGATSSGGSGFPSGAPGSGYRIDLWTGAASDQSTAQTPASGRTTTTSFTQSMTTTASGSQIVLFAEDWNQAGTPTAGTDNTIAGAWDISGQTSGGRVCLTSNAGAAGSYTNRITFGGTPGANWVQYEILEGAALAPTIDTQPSNTTAYSGQTAQFTVAATTSGGTLTYQWQRSTDGGVSYSNVSGGSGATTATYTTPTLGFTENGYFYRCAVSDDNGTTNTNGALLTLIPASPISWLRA